MPNNIFISFDCKSSKDDAYFVLFEILFEG